VLLQQINIPLTLVQCDITQVMIIPMAALKTLRYMPHPATIDLQKEKLLSTTAVVSFTKQQHQ